MGPASKVHCTCQTQNDLIENVPPPVLGWQAHTKYVWRFSKENKKFGIQLHVQGGAELRGVWRQHITQALLWSVGVKGDVPYTFPAPRTTYSGFRDLLGPAYSVRHNYRCRLSSTESWSPVRLSAPNSSPFRSKQIGRVHPETEQEQDLANRLGSYANP